MRGRRNVNAMRSGVVVLGAFAFGYLTLQLGFKPYLERAQLAAENQSQLSSTSLEPHQQEEEQQPNSSSTAISESANEENG